MAGEHEELVPTEKEQKAIDSMRRLAEKWPESLWLFSASNTLHVMRKNVDGQHAVDMGSGGMDPRFSLGTIEIETDGGDW